MLHHAANNGHDNVVSYLLAISADSNKENVVSICGNVVYYRFSGTE